METFCMPRTRLNLYAQYTFYINKEHQQNRNLNNFIYLSNALSFRFVLKENTHITIDNEGKMFCIQVIIIIMYLT